MIKYSSEREKEVWITLNNKIIIHYENLGYKIPRHKDQARRMVVKRGTKILVKIEDLSEGSRVKITKICDICGGESKSQPYNYTLKLRRSGDGFDRCRGCAVEVIKEAKKENFTYEKSLEYHAKIHKKEYLLKEFSVKNNKKPSEIYKSNTDVFIWNCYICNKEYQMNTNNRTNGRGCPLCRESKGEKVIRKWLEDFAFDFKSQKEFDGLLGLGGGNLSFDFYLPKQNILIEYQGEYHDGSGSKNSHTKINLEKQQEHDRRKREFSKAHNIELLEIWYWDFDSIEEILESELIRKQSKLI